MGLACLQHLKKGISTMHDVTQVKLLEDYRLHLTFNDGEAAEVDMAPMIDKGGVFSEPANPAFFSKVAVNADVGTICWPNGAVARSRPLRPPAPC